MSSDFGTSVRDAVVDVKSLYAKENGEIDFSVPEYETVFAVE